MSNSDFSVGQEEAEAITRLSALERLREQARAANRAFMIENVERLITAELRRLKRLRSEAAERPGAD